jgi:hypothetical protein
MPPTGMPTNLSSLPRKTSGAPRSKSDFTHSGASFLVGGNEMIEIFARERPGHHRQAGETHPNVVAAEILRKSLRFQVFTLNPPKVTFGMPCGICHVWSSTWPSTKEKLLALAWYLAGYRPNRFRLLTQALKKQKSRH